MRRLPLPEFELMKYAVFSPFLHFAAVTPLSDCSSSCLSKLLLVFLALHVFQDSRFSLFPFFVMHVSFSLRSRYLCFSRFTSPISRPHSSHSQSSRFSLFVFLAIRVSRCPCFSIFPFLAVRLLNVPYTSRVSGSVDLCCQWVRFRHDNQLRGSECIHWS